jgi:hypothetical protein
LADIEKRVLRRIFGHNKQKKEQEDGKISIMRSFVICDCCKVHYEG